MATPPRIRKTGAAHHRDCLRELYPRGLLTECGLSGKENRGMLCGVTALLPVLFPPAKMVRLGWREGSSVVTRCYRFGSVGLKCFRLCESLLAQPEQEESHGDKQDHPEAEADPRCHPARTAAATNSCYRTPKSNGEDQTRSDHRNCQFVGSACALQGGKGQHPEWYEGETRNGYSGLRSPTVFHLLQAPGATGLLGLTQNNNNPATRMNPDAT